MDTYDKIYTLIENIRQDVKEGFADIHKRIDETITSNGYQNERLTRVETERESTQTELAEFKRRTTEKFGARQNNVFQIVGAIGGSLGTLGLLITWIVMAVKGIV